MDRNFEAALYENGKAYVALLAEGVDRNTYTDVSSGSSDVALLAEGVDRNDALRSALYTYNVALLAEGVDRNGDDKTVIGYKVESPSSRRAWIEMPSRAIVRAPKSKSPSSRRAWIEMR